MWRDSKLAIVAYKLKYMTYFWPHSSAQPTCAGARRHAGGASARFRQDIEVRIDAYESWECPLCVAKFLDMGSYLFVSLDTYLLYPLRYKKRILTYGYGSRDFTD